MKDKTSAAALAAVGSALAGSLGKQALYSIAEAGKEFMRYRYPARSAVGSKRKIRSYKLETKAVMRKIKNDRKRRKRRSTKCKIKKLCKFMKQSMAVHSHRIRDTHSNSCGANANNFIGYQANGTITALEAAMANLRYFDPGTNALVTANPAGGTFQRDINVSIWRRMLVKNNYQIPVYVELYSCIPKVDGSSTPVSLYTSGLADQGDPTNTCVLLNFKDSIDLKNMWECKLLKRGVLKPGSSFIGTRYHKEFEYNFGVTDQHADLYQRRYGGHSWVIKLSGVLGHDPGAGTLVGGAAGQVDAEEHTIYTFKYDAGKDLHDITCVDNADAPVTNFVMSMRPVVDNLAFSKT